MAERVSGEDFKTEVLDAEKPVLVEFYSDSCIPCKKMNPILADIEEEYQDRLNVRKVNVNFDGDITKEYEVKSSPTMILFKAGVETERIVGAVKKTELTNMVEKYL